MRGLPRCLLWVPVRGLRERRYPVRSVKCRWAKCCGRTGRSQCGYVGDTEVMTQSPRAVMPGPRRRALVMNKGLAVKVDHASGGPNEGPSGVLAASPSVGLG